MLHIVGIGGGSGLPVLLRGLRGVSGSSGAERPADFRISAVVCVSDNGGSSGLLRDAFGIPAVGDLRNCLVALSEGPELAGLFQFRFGLGGALGGHSLGNLIVAALCQTHGGLSRAAERAGRLLGITGRVLPACEGALTLCAEFEDGSVMRGEFQVANAGRKIRRVWLEPDHHRPAEGVLEAIAAADSIVFGPGSLYTSILPNILVPGVAAAIRDSAALKIFVCNLMTQPGETDFFSAAEHARVLLSYLGAGGLDICLLNSAPVAGGLQERYQKAGACAVTCEEDEISRLGIVPISGEVAVNRQGKVRHDPLKVARLVVAVTRGGQRARDIIRGQGDLVA